MTNYYAIERNNKYVQEIVPNKRYCPTSAAPTMGKRYDLSEFRAVWGNEPKGFERLTVGNYIATILEQYRWSELKPTEIKIIPCKQGGEQ